MTREELDKLTFEQKRKCIAILCGWHGCKYEDGRYIGMYGPTRGYQEVPDYLNDLNAVHDAEDALLVGDMTDGDAFPYRYSRALYFKTVPVGKQPCRASALERADALLLTVG